jgi:hypothetical protein
VFRLLLPELQCLLCRAEQLEYISHACVLSSGIRSSLVCISLWLRITELRSTIYNTGNPLHHTVSSLRSHRLAKSDFQILLLESASVNATSISLSQSGSAHLLAAPLAH